MTPPGSPSPTAARLGLVLAAVLWSTSGGFVRLLTEPTAVGVHHPPLSPVLVAVYRGLFGGLLLAPAVGRAAVRFRPPMLAVVGCFTAMTGLYLTALGRGPVADAIFLQNTAPVWVCVFGVHLLGHRADRRTWRAVGLAAAGAAVLVAGNWPTGRAADRRAADAGVLLMGLGSGVAYAWVVLLFDRLRGESAVWLTAVNLAGSAAGLVLFVAARHGPAEAIAWLAAPTARQLAFLAVFGAVQMAVPYLLFARGVRAVGPQEAGLITLLEPVLSPLWAYLIAPDREVPSWATVAGGGLLMAALGWRYLPADRGRNAVPRK